MGKKEKQPAKAKTAVVATRPRNKREKVQPRSDREAANNSTEAKSKRVQSIETVYMGTGGEVSKKKAKNPILVVLPGASGALSKDTLELLIPNLNNRFDVRIRQGRWNISKPGAPSNVESVLEICPAVSSGSSFDDDKEWYIMSHSFGNRVCCSMLVGDLFPNPPTKVILSGYPMYGSKCTEERVDLLRQLPTRCCELLCISGSRDEFLLRGPPTAAAAEAAADCRGKVAKKGSNVSSRNSSNKSNSNSDNSFSCSSSGWKGGKSDEDCGELWTAKLHLYQ